MADPLTIGGLVLLGAWLAGRSRASQTAGGSAPASAPAAKEDRFPVASIVDFGEERGDVLLDAVGVVGSNYGVNDDSAMLNQYWQGRFKADIIDVGARIPLSRITPYDVEHAMKLLTGQFDHNAEVLSAGFREEAHIRADLEAGGTTLSILGSIASYIPVIGGVLKASMGAVANEAIAAAHANYARAQAGTRVHLVPDFKQVTPQTLMMMGSPATDCKFISLNCDGAPGRFRHQFLSEMVFDEAARWDLYSPPPFAYPRLFTRTRTGYVHPWLSEENGWWVRDGFARTVSYREAVGRRAMDLRVIDLVMCQFWNAAGINPFGYVFVGGGSGSTEVTGAYGTHVERLGGGHTFFSPTYGVLMGSIYPPTIGEDIPMVQTYGGGAETLVAHLGRDLSETGGIVDPHLGRLQADLAAADAQAAANSKPEYGIGEAAPTGTPIPTSGGTPTAQPQPSAPPPSSTAVRSAKTLASTTTAPSVRGSLFTTYG